MDELNMDVEEQKEDLQTVFTRLLQVSSDESDFDDEVSESEEEQEEWKEEEKKDDGTKWYILEHNGPFFAPDYVPLPSNVKFYYNGQEMKLSLKTEEVATFYARKLDQDYIAKKVFKDNFFHDWCKVMDESERAKITDLEKCNFTQIYKYLTRKLSEEEKKAIAEKKQEIKKEYGFCKINEDEEEIENFKIEPPGIFIGRGENPKMGKLKKRVQPEDVTINCSINSVPKAPEGHEWKSVIHNQKLISLASWTDNILGQKKYIRLSPSSKLKGEIDFQKFETARNLAKNINTIRNTYRENWKSENMSVKQTAVALYFIDKLALRPGNENYENRPHTFGCCNLKVKHVQLPEEEEDDVVIFDFLAKASIKFSKGLSVDKLVLQNLKLFKENKSNEDKLFDSLSTTKMNKYLNEQMKGLTVKVFRTFKASLKLEEKLKELTNPEDSLDNKIYLCNKAILDVTRLCNHKRTNRKTGKEEDAPENTKRYYIDPRIIVAWCKKYGVPIGEIYTNEERKKFQWAMNTDRNFVFAKKFV